MTQINRKNRMLNPTGLRRKKMISSVLARLSALPMLLVVAPLFAAGAPSVANAQALALTVNGVPITTYDIAERMKLLRILRKPASREDAVNSLIADSLKLQEMSHFTIHLNDAQIAQQGAEDAKEAKISAVELAQRLQTSGLDKHNWQEHFRAQAEWNMYVKALNKALDVSTQAVQAEMAKLGKSPDLTEYLVRQVIIVVPNDAGLAQAMSEAKDLRARFSDCRAGVAYARAQPRVVVQSATSRTSATLDKALRTVLDKTPVGHLTEPSRSPQGIEMLALCQRKTVHDASAAGAEIRQRLIAQRLRRASARIYARLRARAVIVRP